MTPIGTIRSPFASRFAVPRQPGLAPSALCQLHFRSDIPVTDAVRGLETFDHVWILFLFHAQSPRWKPLVTPPRLGGKKSVGVFASRSPFRPNPIGLSAVKLVEIRASAQSPHLVLSGGDFVDGTPVIDIKPYLTYTDCIPEASNGWPGKLPKEVTLPVDWSPASLEQLATLCGQTDRLREIQQTINEALALDPRPGYERGRQGRSGQTWAASIAGIDVEWSVGPQAIRV